jgi:hypothetical protein
MGNARTIKLESVKDFFILGWVILI